MSLWVAPAFFALALIVYGVEHDLLRWWRAENGLPEAIRWWLDQRRELRHMQRSEPQRGQIFDQLEDCWQAPCAPDPKWRLR